MNNLFEDNNNPEKKDQILKSVSDNENHHENVISNADDEDDEDVKIDTDFNSPENRIKGASNAQASTNNNKLKLLLVAAIAMVLLISGFKIFHGTTKEVNIEAKSNQGDSNTVTQAFPLTPTKKSPPPIIATDKSKPTNNNSVQSQSQPTPLIRKSDGFLVLSNTSTNNNSKNTKTTVAIAEALTKDTKAAKAKQSNGLYDNDIFEATTAEKQKYNENLLLPKGTYISCNLRSKFVSNVSGLISCNVADNIYSQNGNVLLIPKGSIVNGSYKGGNVNGGSDQMMAIWQEIRTPEQIIINIDSGSADELGAAGLTGKLDTHFFRRFRDAILVSSMTDLIAAASSRMSKQGNQNYLSDTTSQSDSVVRTIIQQNNIQPTLIKFQGDKIGIYVARDVDFSKVYKLSLNR